MGNRVPSFLPSFLHSFLHSFLPSFLPFLTPSSLSSDLPFLIYITLYMIYLIPSPLLLPFHSTYRFLSFLHLAIIILPSLVPYIIFLYISHALPLHSPILLPYSNITLVLTLATTSTIALLATRLVSVWGGREDIARRWFWRWILETKLMRFCLP